MFFSAQLHSIQVHLKKAKVDNEDVLKRMLGASYMGNSALKFFQVPKMSEAQD